MLPSMNTSTHNDHKSRALADQALAFHRAGHPDQLYVAQSRGGCSRGLTSEDAEEPASPVRRSVDGTLNGRALCGRPSHALSTRAQFGPSK